MHRLSESLYAVETFRKMYADTQKVEQARLAELEDVEEQEVRLDENEGMRANPVAEIASCNFR